MIFSSSIVANVGNGNAVSILAYLAFGTYVSNITLLVDGPVVIIGTSSCHVFRLKQEEENRVIFFCEDAKIEHLAVAFTFINFYYGAALPLS